MTDCEHTQDGECDRKIYLGEGVFDPEDYTCPCHACPLDDLPVACEVCGENLVGADDYPVCNYCQSEAMREAINCGAMDEEAVIY